MVARCSFGQERRWRLLDELLVAALQRAVAGADDDDGAMGVGQHLCLDVPGAVEIPLHETLAAAEGADRLPHRGLVQLRNLLRGAGHLEPATPTAERGLDRDRQPVLLGEGEHLIGTGDRVGRAGNQRSAGSRGDVPCGDLVAEIADRLRGRTDPGESGVDDGLGEFGVLGQEPVSRVDGVRAGPGGDVEQFADVQIGVRRRGSAQRIGVVGGTDVHRVPVGIGIHRDRPEPGILGRTCDADGDLATVGDQDGVHAEVLPGSSSPDPAPPSG